MKILLSYSFHLNKNKLVFLSTSNRHKLILTDNFHKYIVLYKTSVINFHTHKNL